MPEEVEKKEPPIITKIKNTKYKSDWFWSIEIPIFEMLLVIEKKTDAKLLPLLKKMKNNINKNIKYINR